MMGMPTPPPLEYDPSTRMFRANASSSAPGTLAWVLVIMLAVFGFEDHMMWVVAGVLAAVVLLVQWGLRRRSAAGAAQAEAARDEVTRR